MATQFRAAPSNRGYIPAFTVEKLEGTYTKNMASKVGFGLETAPVETERGWLVTFPRGHSIHIETMAELKRMGFTATEVPLVDEDGDVVGSIPNKIQARRVKIDA